MPKHRTKFLQNLKLPYTNAYQYDDREVSSLPHFSIVFQNVRGLRTKSDDMLRSIMLSEFDAVVLVETWLTSDFISGEYFDPRYQVLRNDRVITENGPSRGRGVLVATRLPLNSSIIEKSDLPEALCVRVSKPGIDLILSAVYFRPNAPICVYMTFFDRLECLQLASFGTKFMVIGDFNCSAFNEASEHMRDNRDCDIFLLMEHYLGATGSSQLNLIQNCFGRKLDLVFTNVEPSCCLISHLPDALVRVDLYRPSLLIEVPAQFSASVNAIAEELVEAAQFYDFKLANYELLYCTLRDSDWAVLFRCSEVDSAVKLLYATIYMAFDIAVPLRN